MRTYQIFIPAIALLMFPGCKKNQNAVTSDAEQSLINQSKSYFESEKNHFPPMADSNPRVTSPRTVNWEKAQIITLSVGKAVLVPIKYDKELFIRTTQGGENNFQLSNLTRLLVYQVKGVYHAEVVTSLPDTNHLRHPQGAFSGFVFVEDWAGHSVTKYLYDGKNIFKYAAPSSTPTVRSLSAAPLELCYQLTGYNYSTAEPYGGYAWAEAPVCTPSMVPVDDPTGGYPSAPDYGGLASGGSGGGLSSSNGTSNASSFTVQIGHNLISDIRDYFKCFANTSFGKFQVMVCVDQPVPGERTAWSFSPSDGSSKGTNPFSVGHTFLVFTETIGETTITRNVGFYPGKLVDPIISYSAPGTLNNDEMHYYNISGTFTVNNILFFNMLNYVTQNGNKNYDLNENNCTTFAINTLSAGHIYLPNTIGSWLNGMGVDPGDLGEDIRATNFAGMTRSTDQIIHMNNGFCN